MAAVEQFCIYAHEDHLLQEQLHAHFALARRAGLLVHYADRDIGAGGEWRGAINQYLESAEIILILISAAFFSSDYAYDREMTRALERHRAGEAVVIPVILRPCDWPDGPFGGIQALPRGMSITDFANIDEGFRQVVVEVKKVAMGIQDKKNKT